MQNARLSLRTKPATSKIIPLTTPCPQPPSLLAILAYLSRSCVLLLPLDPYIVTLVGWKDFPSFFFIFLFHTNSIPRTTWVRSCRGIERIDLCNPALNLSRCGPSSSSDHHPISPHARTAPPKPEQQSTPSVPIARTRLSARCLEGYSSPSREFSRLLL